MHINRDTSHGRNVVTYAPEQKATLFNRKPPMAIDHNIAHLEPKVLLSINLKTLIKLKKVPHPSCRTILG